jgi:uncharacterized membrane protein YqjE
MGAHMSRRWFKGWLKSSDKSAADTSTGESGGTATASTAPSDLVGNSKQLLTSFLMHVRTRLELLGIELAIEKSRLMRNVVAWVLTGFFALLTLSLGVLYVIAVYWDTPYRLTAVACLMFAAFVLTLVAAVFLVQRLRVPSVLFSASAAELSRDIEALEKV